MSALPTAHITTAEELSGDIPPERLAAWVAENDKAVAAMPEKPALLDVERMEDPRTDPAFEQPPIGWRPGDPRIAIERRGPAYLVDAEPSGLRFVFREVRTDRELSADVSVALEDRHLFRTTSTLSLAAREKLAKLAAEFTPLSYDVTRLAVFRATEAVIAAEEHIVGVVDLRTAGLTSPAGSHHALAPFWHDGSVVLNGPGEAGKSTVARGCSVSLATGLSVLPGIEPQGDPCPVLFVAAEDPVAHWHTKSIEAICRGLGIDRASIPQPIELFDARGRALHRIARALAERASDFGAIVLDSQQALLAQADATGGIRDRDSLFWNAVDQLERPTMIISHPNRADARDWQRVDDGRVAGSEVNRDRARMAWRVTWKDEAAVVGTSYRRYTLANVKNNHGPREEPLSFGAAWTFGFDGDPGELHFLPSDPIRIEGKLSPELGEALKQYQAGNTTPAPLAAALGIGPNTAKSRLRLLRERGLLSGSEDVS